MNYGLRLFHIWKESNMSVSEFAQKLGKSSRWVLSQFRWTGAVCCNFTHVIERCEIFYLKRAGRPL